MDSSSFCTSESIRSVSHLEEEVDSIEDRQDLTLPLTSSNLEMLQVSRQVKREEWLSLERSVENLIHAWSRPSPLFSYV